jgi:hypothetical protein
MEQQACHRTALPSNQASPPPCQKTEEAAQRRKISFTAAKTQFFLPGGSGAWKHVAPTTRNRTAHYHFCALLSTINHALPLQLSIHNSPNMPNCRAAQSQRTVSLMSLGKKNHISSSFSLSVSSTSMNHNFLPVPWHHRILDHHPGRPSPVESGLPSRNGGNRTKCKARHT